MEPRIRERFSQLILTDAAARYGADTGTLHELDGAESFIFEFTHKGQPRILRIGHSLRRTPNLIRGEVDWINYLARGGAAVAPAVLSQNDELVELLDDGAGAQFLATAFVKAAGGPPDWAEQSPAFIEQYGQAIGRMHRLTKTYTPAAAAWQRPQWDDPSMTDAIAFLPAAEASARHQLAGLIARLQQLPKDPESYGLVHQDAHLGNCFATAQGELTFFDFDDCCYTWFVNDIAIVLFYVVNGRADPAAYARSFLPHFLRGYGRENRFDAQWFATIPDFLKLRELDLYAVIHRSFDVNNLDHPWVARYMDGRKARIEAELPYVAYDFAGLQWA
jgi:Ser/Thr protein kinase RdoA (MazF antagonist)